MNLDDPRSEESKILLQWFSEQLYASNASDSVGYLDHRKNVETSTSVSNHSSMARMRHQISPIKT